MRLLYPHKGYYTNVGCSAIISDMMSCSCPGQQFYTQAVTTPKVRPFLSFLVGWAVIVGEVSTGSSCALNSANIIQSFVEITYPDYVWHSWLTWLIYCIFLIGPVVINLTPKYLPAMNIFGAFWTIAGGIAWTVSFGVMAPKQSSDFVFQTFMKNCGYTSTGWSSSCLSVSYTILKTL
jgi:choline transport protein